MCYPAKLNFWKLNRGNLGCSLGCIKDKSKAHIFEKFGPIRAKLKLNISTSLASIYQSVSEQKEIITLFEQIDDQRKILMRDILPGNQ